MWGNRRSASKRQLQSLIGLLNHAAKMVRLGHPFLRSLIDTMKIPQRQDQKSASTSSVTGTSCGGRSSCQLGTESVSSRVVHSVLPCTLMRPEAGVVGPLFWIQRNGSTPLARLVDRGSHSS